MLASLRCHHRLPHLPKSLRLGRSSRSASQASGSSLCFFLGLSSAHRSRERAVATRSRWSRAAPVVARAQCHRYRFPPCSSISIACIDLAYDDSSYHRTPPAYAQVAGRLGSGHRMNTVTSRVCYELARSNLTFVNIPYRAPWFPYDGWSQCILYCEDKECREKDGDCGKTKIALPTNHTSRHIADEDMAMRRGVALVRLFGPTRTPSIGIPQCLRLRAVARNVTVRWICRFHQGRSGSQEEDIGRDLADVLQRFVGEGQTLSVCLLSAPVEQHM